MQIKMLWYGRKMQGESGERTSSASSTESEQQVESGEHRRPRGFVALGVFFLFGATMAAYAAITLLKPGTALDGLWVLNKAGHAQLAQLGKGVGVGFVVLSALMCAAAVGWFRRRYWGWVLGTTIIALNAAGDLINAVRGEHLKGGVGVVIAGLLLIYMTRLRVRKYFDPKTK